MSPCNSLIRSPSAVLVLAASLGLLPGCPGGGGGFERDAAPDAVEYNGTLEVGQGNVTFETLPDDEDLILWSGPQGGHHFIIHVRVKDIDPGNWERPGQPGNPITTFSAFDESGRQVDLMVPPYAIGYRDLGDEWLYFPSGRFLRTDEIFVPGMWNNRVRVVVEVVDANGVRARDERWIVAIHEPDPDGGDAGPTGPDAGPPDAGP